MIAGNPNPVVGKEEFYQYQNPLDPFNSTQSIFVWFIWKKQKNGTWVDITTASPKMGQRVPFTFGQKVIGQEFKLEVFQSTPIFGTKNFDSTSVGEIFLIPTANSKTKINKVILFNKGAKNPNKANYADTLVARAYCIGMFNQEVEFRLWEDDAAGGGHDATINKNNQLPQVFKAKVNEKGIAEVKISLLSNEKVLKSIANKYVMSGDKNEGANHEFYVTASYNGKIQKASQVNVDVANSSNKPKPKQNSPKFPATTNSKSKKQPDPKGKITDAYFVNDKNQKLSRVPIDYHVKVQILSKGMKDRFIQYVVWEEDFNFFGIVVSHDEIYRSGGIKIDGDVITTEGFKITEPLFKKGISKMPGDTDNKSQNYFLEIIIFGSEAESSKFGLDNKVGQKMEVVMSAAVVRNSEKINKKDNGVCECEARVRAFIRMLRVKEGTNGEIGYTTQYSGKRFSDFSTHPQKVITDSKGKHSSSAAGAYQIMTDTWKNLTGHYQGKDKQWHYSEKLDYSKKYNIKSFDQESQDKFCLVIMKHNYLQDRSDSFYNPTVWKNKEKKIHDTAKEEKLKDWRKRFKGQQGDIIQMIIANDIKKAALVSSLCWASLPDSPYGQQSSAYTFAIVKAIYEKNLREELIEPNKELYLKKGFLKEFGYGCCSDGVQEKSTTPESKCPEDCSQCFDYADVWDNPEISSDNNGKNNNRYGKSTRGHKGIDILSGPKYKDVHSLMCGTVEKVTTSFKTNQYGHLKLGNIVNIKSKDKDGKTVYILYCHLDKVYVKEGQIVKHGEKIALSGSTGNASSDEFPNGMKGHGINKKYWHCHIEASSDGAKAATFFGKDRLQPEDYMKTKFDKDGNAIK